MANVVSYGGNTYTTNGLIGNSLYGGPQSVALGSGSYWPQPNQRELENAVTRGWLQPYQMPQQQQQPQYQQPMSTMPIQPHLNKLTTQANDALYGGILGYNPKPMMSGGSDPQAVPVPQGNFRDAFAGMQGLLGGNQWRGGY